MAKTVKEMLAAAEAAVPRVPHDEARRLIAEQGAVVVDVREPQELANGKVKGAISIPRGLIEFRADAASALHHPALTPDRPVIVYCASGGRAALVGQTLQEMGFSAVYNLGGFKEWADAGCEVEPG